ncbi:MAG TPA: autotransporter-associated beta strand repeat-containing protein, partial [Verrucomicrobiae bacterium]|nr:autotransporter-associated beta strand repeat-containing protein [Verrucomicrobiae bacterium]
MKIITKTSVLLIALFLSAAQHGWAATTIWVGVNGVSTTTNWSTAANFVDVSSHNPESPANNAANFNYNTAVASPGLVTVNVDGVYAGQSGTSGIYTGNPQAWGIFFGQTNGYQTVMIQPGINLCLTAANSTPGGGNFVVAPQNTNTGGSGAGNSVAIPYTNYTTFTGIGGTFIANCATVRVEAQSSVVGNHYSIFDMSGLGTFVYTNTSGAAQNLYVAGNGSTRSHALMYFAHTNVITLGTAFQIGNLSATSSNSQPIGAYLGQSNYISTGTGNSNMLIGGLGVANAFLKFNPAFIGGATMPTAYITAPGGNQNAVICSAVGGAAPGSATCDLTGGNVTWIGNSLNMGISGSATGAGTAANGVLTFDNGTIAFNTIQVGDQTVSAGSAGVGTINIGTNATLIANGKITLGAVTGTANASTSGTINITTNGTLQASSITNGGAGSKVNMTNATWAVALSSTSVTNMAVGTFNAGGSTNIINITSITPFLGAAFPVRFHLISSPNITGASTLGVVLPASYNPSLPYGGYIDSTTTPGVVDFVLTSGPPSARVLTWSGLNGGSPDGDWDVGSTPDWLTNGVATVYNQFDLANFNDIASPGQSNINLTTTLTPYNVTVSNAASVYTFGGAGNLSGAAGLTKQGAGALIIDNSGVNNYTGGTTVSGGTLQVGNGDSSGNVPGNITDNASLVFDRTDTVNVTNPIVGSGTVTLAGGGTVELSGLNTFTNTLMVTNNSTLQLGGANATGNASAAGGSVVIANGATLDINGNSVAKKILVSGAGSGNGAITDSGGSVYDNPGSGVASNITLLGDATFNFPVRWDLGSPGSGCVLSTGGQPYNLTLNGNGYYEWRNLAVDSALANITVESGTLGIVGTTSLGNPSGTLTLSSSGSGGITFYNSSLGNANVNKQIDFQSGPIIANGGGNNSMSGPMTLESGYCQFNPAGGTLTLSNVISGPGTLYQNGGTGTLVLAGNSPSFTGGVSLWTGNLVLTGSIGSGITAVGGSTTLSGTGTANGVVDFYGSLLPGGSGVPGTLTVGGLTVESGSTLTMDLSATNTVGSGVNDLIVINGDLNANNNILYINPIGSSFASSYTLMTYTGNANSFFSGASTIGATRYVFNLVNNTNVSPSQVNLSVSGGPDTLLWDNANGSAFWDTLASGNWSNLVTHVSSDYFYTQDSVIFDDSILTAPSPATNIFISGVVSPNKVTNNSTASYTFGGTGKISGGASIIKLGSGTLTINTTNDFNGGVTVAGGKVIQGASSAFGATTGSLYITNGGTVDLNGYSLNARPVIVSGTGVGGNGAIINNSTSPVYDNPGGLTSVTLTGNATFGAGASRWDLGSSSGGTLSTGGQAYSLTLAGVAGSTYWEWDNMTIDPAFANINILGGQLGVKGMTSLGNPAGTVTINGGGQFTFWGGSGYAKNFDVKSNGVLQVRQTGPTFNFNTTLEGGSTLQSLDLAKTITGSINLTGLAEISVQSGALTLLGVISGPGGFYMDNSDANPLVLSNVNTYTGETLLTNSGGGCTLALINTG